MSVQNVGEQAGRVGRLVSVWKAGGRVDWSGGVLRSRWTDDRQEDRTRQAGGRLAGETVRRTAWGGCAAPRQAAALQHGERLLFSAYRCALQHKPVSIGGRQNKVRRKD